MKALLLLSLALNVVLGWKLYELSQRPPLERIVLEHKISPQVQEAAQDRPSKASMQEEIKLKVSEEKGRSKKRNKDSSLDHLPYDVPFNEAEWQDELEKVDLARRNFLEKENIDPEILERARKLKQEFQKKSQALYVHEYPGELSIENRKKALALEEKYQKDLENLFGKEKWKKFQDFKQRYNQGLYKNLSGQDRAPRAFVPMDF